jgi:phosphate transport system permease protein
VLPKYGLSPLLWGTFKAALYGMVVAVPLALGAAIYTGYFLPPRRRNQVKPAVEMLEAFPTVVLGFIAGLWLAPLLGEYLVFVLLAPVVLILAPLLLAGLHLIAQRLSLRFVRRPPRIALVLLVYLAGLLILASQASAIEALFFDGSLRNWLWRSLGLQYDQRNALLVGFAMGLAITPVMFSIVEDAINAVPRRLSDGSLALGATRWQALWRVVLPAASPALLSALLIGFARGLGETMIVLLATGNAPLMLADPFSGLRSLAANIAVELPEAGAGGVHFRLLFLSAFVLFLLTFFLNTLAEFFRQRLRYAYAGR